MVSTIKIKIIGLLSLMTLAAPSCLQAPGSGTEPPNFIQTGGTNTDGGGASTVSGLPNYQASGSAVVAFRALLSPVTISNLQITAGAGGSGTVRVSVDINDFASYAEGCKFAIRFIKNSSYDSVIVYPVTISTTEITAHRVTAGDFSLSDYGYAGGIVGTDAVVYAYLKCGSLTTNVLYRSFAQ